MPVSSMKELLEAGVHFGHHTRKWNPKMKPFIYGARNDIYIIDLHKTRRKLEEAYEQVRARAFNGQKFLFVGTKKQAQDSIKEAAEACDQFFVNSRWLGGMLTNWPTIQTRIDRLNQLDKMTEDGTMEKLPKKEAARLGEEREKLTAVLGGIRTMSGPPDVMFIVDCKKEHIAIQEAHRLEIPIVAVVDTNCDPDEVDYVVPGNDDAIRAVRLMAMQMAEAINEGRGMAQSIMEERAANLQGAGAASFGGGQLDYVGATPIELPPVASNDEDFDMSLVDQSLNGDFGDITDAETFEGTMSHARTSKGGGQTASVSTTEIPDNVDVSDNAFRHINKPGGGRGGGAEDAIKGDPEAGSDTASGDIHGTALDIGGGSIAGG